MEDALHCNFDSVVVRVDRFWVMRPAGWVERLSGGQEGFDSFVSEDEQRSHRSEPGWERLVAAGVADPADDVFAAEFLQIIRGVAGAILARAILARALFTECAHAGGDRTAPPPARSSPASQHSGHGGLSGKQIGHDPQLSDL